KARATDWHIGIGLQGGVRAGLSPIVQTMEMLFIDVRRGAPDATPSFRVSLAHANPVTAAEGFPPTRFGWNAAAADVCVLRLGDATVDLRTCLGGHFGIVYAKGMPSVSDAAGYGTERFWADGALTLRFDVRPARMWAIEAQGETLVPFTRYRFAFD